jgi:hypothetical protein
MQACCACRSGLSLRGHFHEHMSSRTTSDFRVPHIQPPIMDIYLPLLCSPSAPLRLGVAHALSRALRSPAQRRAVMDWTLPTERIVESRTNRGWEKPTTSVAGASVRGGGWVARQLSEWLRERDVKVHAQCFPYHVCLTELVGSRSRFTRFGCVGARRSPSGGGPQSNVN